MTQKTVKRYGLLFLSFLVFHGFCHLMGISKVEWSMAIGYFLCIVSLNEFLDHDWNNLRYTKSYVLSFAMVVLFAGLLVASGAVVTHGGVVGAVPAR